MKQPSDLYTAELPGISTPRKRGRKLIGQRAMTDAERMRRYRANKRKS